MHTQLVPTTVEVEKWLRCTLKHSAHVEYYLHHLGVGHEDPERPHDLVGPGNKLEWDVIRGFALQFRNPQPDFDIYTLPALKRHRMQYHHRMWNEPDVSDRRKHNRDATPDALQLGAIDAICSLLEPRGYQGGAHSFEEIQAIIAKSAVAHKQPWLERILPRMQELPAPNLDVITSLRKFPNVGVPVIVHRAMDRRITDALHELFTLGYYAE